MSDQIGGSLSLQLFPLFVLFVPQIPTHSLRFPAPGKLETFEQSDSLQQLFGSKLIATVQYREDAINLWKEVAFDSTNFLVSPDVRTSSEIRKFNVGISFRDLDPGFILHGPQIYDLLYTQPLSSLLH